METYNSLQLREIFHLEFLKWFGKKVKPANYILKGGVNLRLFFKSFRYSEDMDLDSIGIDVGVLKDIVMKILKSPSFQDNLRPFGVENIVPPNIIKAKQTETTQRFKIHLITAAGEDLFTKIEFSRRGFRGKPVIEPVSYAILREYKMAPLLVSHYDAYSTAAQKINALASRSIIQARDVFDLFILTPQLVKIKKETGISEKLGIFTFAGDKLKKAYDNIFVIKFEQFRDSVLFYLSPEDRAIYETPARWDEIKLKAADFIDEIKKRGYV